MKRFGRRDWHLFASGWMSCGAAYTALDEKPWWWVAILLVGATLFAFTPDNWHSKNNWQSKAKP